MSATIVFRGLLVFLHKSGVMQIGVLENGKSGHVPRIITTKDGVIKSIFDLRTRPEFGTIRDWEIEVTNPLQPMAVTFQQNETFNRRNHPHARDYRWMTDLEAPDLHDRDLSNEIDTSRIKLVLKVRHGEFYTRQLSRPLIRKQVRPAGGNNVFFGMAAEVTGCDIEFNVGQLRLKAGNTVAFRFDKGIEDGVIYEFSNAPPDVLPDKPHPPGGHFHMYYHNLFKTHPPNQQFDLFPENDPNPAPDPATCGGTKLGRRTGDL
jgi:hypothetical protein